MGRRRKIPPAPLMVHLPSKFRADIVDLNAATLDMTTRNTGSRTKIKKSTSSSSMVTTIFNSHEKIINSLEKVATRMNQAGYLNDCIQIYIEERSSVYPDILEILKVERLTLVKYMNDMQSVRPFIKNWCLSANFCVKVLILLEKQLCQQIFHHLLDENDIHACFVDIIQQFITQLFDSVEQCLTSPQPFIEPPYMFKHMFEILDLYSILSKLLPLINHLFSSQISKPIRDMPAQFLLRLAQSIQWTLLDYETNVLHVKILRRIQQFELNKFAKKTIDPLTRDVMNDIHSICSYKETLMELTLSKPLSQLLDEFPDYEQQTPLSLHLSLILMQLFSFLERKSKLCYKKDPSLGNLFLLKNVDYIVGEIERSSTLGELIGDGYMKKKLSSKLCQVKVAYLGFIFDKALHCLLEKRGGIFSSIAEKMTNRLKSFNKWFGEANDCYSNLVASDSQLVVDFKQTIFEKSVPAYISFLKMLKSVKGRKRGGISSSRTKKMTDRLKSFNKCFGEANEYFSNLAASDSQLVVDLEQSIIKKLVPAYILFLEKLKSVKGSGEHNPQQHIWYSAKELEENVLRMFKGKRYYNLHI